MIENIDLKETKDYYSVRLFMSSSVQISFLLEKRASPAQLAVTFMEVAIRVLNTK